MSDAKTVLIIACLASSLAAANQETLRETVRRHGGPIEEQIRIEYSPLSLPDIVHEGDLVVRAVVLGAGRSYLSDGERSIQTDYTFQVLDRFFSAGPPRSGEHIIITKPGGRLTIEGHPVTSYEPDFPEFEPNDEYILFLKYDRDRERYEVPSGAQGAFRIVGGVVEQVSKYFGTWNRERGRVPVLHFTEELALLVKKPRK